VRDSADTSTQKLEKFGDELGSANTATERAREEDEENCQQNADRKVGEQ
jgi:hypothetical protein